VKSFLSSSNSKPQLLESSIPENPQETEDQITVPKILSPKTKPKRKLSDEAKVQTRLN